MIINWIIAILALMLCLLTLFLTIALAGSPCKKELESIVKASKNCAENYLQKISKELSAQTALLFTSSASAVVADFEQKYQVVVQLTSPFANFNYSDSCYRIEANGLPLNVSDSYQTVTFNTSNLPPLPITSYQVEAVANQFYQHYNMGLYVYIPSDQFATATVIFEGCTGEPSMNVTFDDSALLEQAPDYCPGFSSGARYKSVTPLSEVFEGRLLNEPFQGDFYGGYNFNGGVLQSFALILCSKQGSPFSFDQSRSVINYPAFRSDPNTEKFYYTEVIRNSVGEMLYLTIEKDASTLTCS